MFPSLVFSHTTSFGRAESLSSYQSTFSAVSIKNKILFNYFMVKAEASRYLSKNLDE